MVDRRYPRDRRAERVPRKGTSGPAQAKRRVYRHRLYGEIPLVSVSITTNDGKVHRYWRYDLDFAPPLPAGAVRGNVRNQSFCTACHVPKYFFVDEDRTCVQCGRNFVFGADEQKYWYERLKFHFSSVPVRCIDCRRVRRSERALRDQIAVARAQVRQNLSDPAAHLALAQSIVEHHVRTGHGNLDQAIAAARKAAELWPGAVEPRYWEAVAQVRASRSSKARMLLSSVVSQARSLRPGLREKARILLRSLGGERRADQGDDAGADHIGHPQPSAGVRRTVRERAK